MTAKHKSAPNVMSDYKVFFSNNSVRDSVTVEADCHSAAAIAGSALMPGWTLENVFKVRF